MLLWVCVSDPCVRRCRRTVTGVAVGIWIGAVGTFLLFPEREPHDFDDKEETPTTLAHHEALRYGVPSSANVLVRSGYVASYDYR